MSQKNEQKLIDLCFEMVLTITSKPHIYSFNKKSNEEKAKWVKDQLEQCGFKTTPCGSSLGLLDRSLTVKELLDYLATNTLQFQDMVTEAQELLRKLPKECVEFHVKIDNSWIPQGRYPYVGQPEYAYRINPEKFLMNNDTYTYEELTDTMQTILKKFPFQVLLRAPNGEFHSPLGSLQSHRIYKLSNSSEVKPEDYMKTNTLKYIDLPLNVKHWMANQTRDRFEWTYSIGQDENWVDGSILTKPNATFETNPPTEKVVYRLKKADPIVQKIDESVKDLNSDILVGMTFKDEKEWSGVILKKLQDNFYLLKYDGKDNLMKIRHILEMTNLKLFPV